MQEVADLKVNRSILLSLHADWEETWPCLKEHCESVQTLSGTEQGQQLFYTAPHSLLACNGA